MELKFNVGDKVRMVDDLNGVRCNRSGCMAKYGEIIEVDKYDDEMPYFVLFVFNDYEEHPLWCEECQLELIKD